MFEKFMHILEILSTDAAKAIVSNLSTIATTLVAVVGLFNVRSWLRQAAINRRATIASDSLDQLESFYSKLQELVEWDQHESWKDWGNSFKEIFQTHFLLGKLKAHRLQEPHIDKMIKELEKLARELPKSQRYCAQTTQGSAQIHMDVEELEKNKEAFLAQWKEFRVKWDEVNELLTHIGLYDRKRNIFSSKPDA